MNSGIKIRAVCWKSLSAIDGFMTASFLFSTDEGRR
jgi:hypothetical protein